MKLKFRTILIQVIIVSLISIILNQLYWVWQTNESIQYYETLQPVSTVELEDSSQIIESSTFDESTIYEYKPNNHLRMINENPDYVGWVVIENTGINYPVVRASDNAYYLNKDFNKKSSKAGAIFMDYRNLGQFNDRHTVVYGHYMKDGSMFGDLHLYKSEAFYRENTQIKLTGLYDEKTYTIFSVTIETADDYEIDIRVLSDSYISDLKEASLHPFEAEIDRTKNILTLVTCSYEIDNGRIIIHAYENE